MKSRFTQVLMAAALVAPLFAGAAIAQPSGGPGPNAASSAPNPPNSLPMGATTGQTGPADGRIVLQPQTAGETMPRAMTERRMTRRQAARARSRARRAAMRPSAVTASPADTTTTVAPR